MPFQAVPPFFDPPSVLPVEGGLVEGVVVGDDEPPPVPKITIATARTAAPRPTTAMMRAVGKPARLATIPCASRRRANQSSRPSSPRGGSTPGPLGPPLPPLVSNSPILPRNLTRRIRSQHGVGACQYVDRGLRRPGCGRRRRGPRRRARVAPCGGGRAREP